MKLVSEQNGAGIMVPGMTGEPLNAAVVLGAQTTLAEAEFSIRESCWQVSDPEAKKSCPDTFRYLPPVSQRWPCLPITNFWSAEIFVIFIYVPVKYHTVKLLVELISSP